MLFHGSGNAFSVGDVVRPDKDGYVYVSDSKRWADAFAFNDAASRLLATELAAALAEHRPIRLAAARKAGTVATVNAGSPLAADPDYLTAAESLRTRGSVTVTGVQRGSIASWRELTEVIGPHQRWSCDEPIYDADGFLQMPSDWQRRTGRSSADLRPLGPWCPRNSFWIHQNREIVIVSEASIAGLGLSSLRTWGHARALTAADARLAAQHWWQ